MSRSTSCESRFRALSGITGVVAAAWIMSLAACGGPSRIEVAPPTGDRDIDRAALAGAFGQALPGETIQFQAGTYLIGGEPIALRTPDVSLVGDPAGTTLLGCTLEELDALTPRTFMSNCGGVRLEGEAQRVANLRFESFALSLEIALPVSPDGPELERAFTGGHILERNSFVNSFSLQIELDADSTVVVRDNEFLNTWHAVAISVGMSA